MESILLFIAAVLPAIVLVFVLYRADTAEREPKGLVARCFLFGALSVIPILTVEMIAIEITSSLMDTNTMAFLFVETLLCIALVEEFFKMGAGMLAVWKNKNFNYVFDGVLYFGVAALGFACIENISYVVIPDVTNDAVGTAIVRAVITVPSHMFDGMVMGLCAGYAKLYTYTGRRKGARKFIVLALLLPICEHCIFDFCASIGDDGVADILTTAIIILEYIIGITLVVKTHGKKDIRIPLPEDSAAVTEGAVADSPAAGEPVVTSAPAAGAVPVHGSSAEPQTERKQKYCKHCGKLVRETDKFCQNCGGDLR